jgi:hypothetical protein
MQGLLDSESPYMQQALLAGQRQAASRGALSSSLAAGAAQAAAIQAAFPIAAADAQTYSRVLSENAAAINNVNMAKMQSTTQMATTIMEASAAMAQAQLSAQTQLDTTEMTSRTSLLTAQMGAQTQLDATAMQAESAANIATMQANMQGSLGAMSANSAERISQRTAQVQADIAQMNVRMQQEGMHFQFYTNQMEEMQRQNGRVELANLDFGFRNYLQEQGFAHDFDLASMSFEQQREVLRLGHEYALIEMDVKGNIDYTILGRQIESGATLTLFNAHANALIAANTSGMDAEGAAAATANAIRAINELAQALGFYPSSGAEDPDNP